MAIYLIDALNIIDSLDIAPHIETLCLESAIDRICAVEIKATIDLPGSDNSAMDGYAIKLQDAGKSVHIVETILAGSLPKNELQPGKAIKVMTGAKLPVGTEAVVPIEDVEYEGENVKLPSKIKPKANMRFKGEDIAQGEKIVTRGQKLDAFQIALLASQGISYIDVYKKPLVAIFATGSELKMHFESLQASQIYNSNTPSFYARCLELGCDVRLIRSSGDNLDSIKRAIENALDADLIITSGGMSVGEADFTKEAFKEMGMEIFFSKIDVKPGKPTTLGKIGSTFVLNLPGNPLAAQLNFELFGRTLINRLKGLKAYHLCPIRAKLKEKFINKPGRDTIIPGFFDGEYFYPTTKRASGMVSTMAKANGFIIASKEVSELKKEVLFIPLWEFYANEPKRLIST